MLGISPVHQELQLEPYLSVAENIFLGRQPTGRLGIVDHQRMHREARHLLDSLGVTIDSTAPIESISIAQRQIVAIARAVLGTARVIIFDEPTSSLTERETALLFEMISKLRKTGIGIIYISHRIEEIFRLFKAARDLDTGSPKGALDPYRFGVEANREAFDEWLLGGSIVRVRLYVDASGLIRDERLRDNPRFQLRGWPRRRNWSG